MRFFQVKLDDRIFYSKNLTEITSPCFMTKKQGETELIGVSLSYIIHIIQPKHQEI